MLSVSKLRAKTQAKLNTHYRSHATSAAQFPSIVPNRGAGKMRNTSERTRSIAMGLRRRPSPRWRAKLFQASENAAGRTVKCEFTFIVYVFLYVSYTDGGSIRVMQQIR